MSRKTYSNKLKELRIGETMVANNGLSMEIIRYNGASDVDIQFEDGVIVEHKSYNAFSKGMIKHPNIQRKGYHDKKFLGNRCGETSTAVNGMKMTIIEYRSATDLDIQFEDGAIVTNRTYRRFKDGCIRHPDKRAQPRLKNNHADKIGEKGVSLEGETIEIVAYTRANNITVRFPDGFTLDKATYVRFKDGKISRYNNHIAVEEQRKSRIGTTVKCKNGLIATVIDYKLCGDMAVQFEDGVVVKHVKWSNFNNGVVKHPDIPLEQVRKLNRKIIKKHIGETNTNRLGYKMTIVDYFGTSNVIVQFEDGVTKGNVRYSDFKRGRVRHPRTLTNNADIIEKRIGEVNYNKSGLKMTIVDYRIASDIDVQFEDGTIVKHKTYDAFKRGGILKDTHKRGNYRKRNTVSKQKRLGEESLSKEGIPIKIIKYNNANDIDVEFENGIILRSTTYQRFKDKGLSMKTSKRPVINIQERIGETVEAHNGMKMTIINYRSSTDVDIEFEDGTVVEHKYYKDFKHGMIKNPNLENERCDSKHMGVKDVTNAAYLSARDKHLGEEITARCGLKAKIIEYYGTSNITVQFEDGAIVTNMNYAQFNKGAIRHPKFKQRSDFYRVYRLGEKKKHVCGMLMEIIGYNNYNDITVKFEDGSVIEHTTYKKFSCGTA